MIASAFRARRFLAAACLLSFAHAAWAAGKEVEALVRTESLAQRHVAESLTGYGVVIPDPAKTMEISVPRPGEITRLVVSQGMVVSAGDPLFELDTAPSASLEYQQAKSNVAFAQTELQRIENMAAQHLVTESRLAAARKAAIEAQAALAAQSSVGSGEMRQTIRAPFAGVISGLNVHQGDRIPAGTGTLQISRLGAYQVRLGIEPEDSSRVRVGLPVTLTGIFGSGKPVKGRVVRVTGLINPQTRLVDIVVQVEPGRAEDWIPGLQVRGSILVSAAKRWIVPRNAVLRDARGAYLYQVSNGRAQRVAIQVGPGSRSHLAVSGDFDPGKKVVVVGNYELTDGMKVREAGP